MYAAEDLYTEDQDDLEIIEEPEETETLDVQEEGANENEQQNENTGEEAATDTKTTKAKRIVRNPLPKLNVETLQSAKGLQALPSLFEKVKFKGKGHEEEDLNVLIKNYEYWCHRLFPKLPLDDCLAKIETLGHKKPVQTYVKKIRMDLLTDEVTQVPNDEDSEEETTEAAPNDPFDEIAQPDVAEEPIQLTEAQLEQIRLNRERALKLRMERLQKIKDTAANHLPTTQDSIQDSSQAVFVRNETSALNSDVNVDSTFDLPAIDLNEEENNVNSRNSQDDDVEDEVISVSKNKKTVLDSSDSEIERDESISNTPKESNPDEANMDSNNSRTPRVIHSSEDEAVEDAVIRILKHKKTVLDNSDSEIEQDATNSNMTDKTKKKHNKSRVIESSEEEAEVSDMEVSSISNTKENEEIVSSNDINSGFSDNPKENSLEHGVDTVLGQIKIAENDQKIASLKRTITDVTNTRPTLEEEMDIDSMLDEIEADA